MDLDVYPAPRLLASRGARGRYAALSYVWGEGHYFKTSLQDLERMCVSITMTSLLKLFQDAILLTRLLDIPYV